MIERILHEGKELALIIRSSFSKDGIEFFTPNDYSQQLGYMKRPSGYLIAPHVHNTVPSKVSYTSEVLFIRSGRVRVDFYNIDRCYLESSILERGDIILLALCGHGFEMLEETEIVEVRQGPYAGEQDKTRFAAIPESLIKIRQPE
jgi:hypothetical protein